MIPRFLLLLLLCLPAQAQRRTEKPDKDSKADGGAPGVYAQEVNVVRGRSVDITLRGSTRTSADISFIIRDKPKLGRLADEKPKQKDPSHAIVTYTASPEGKGKKDTFTFAGQVPGSSVGEAQTVTIHITDPAVRLDTIETVEVKRAVLGQPAERTFPIRNGGSAPWEAKLPAPKGWKWIHPAEGAFRLAPGAEIDARISCLAAAVGAHAEELDLKEGRKITFRSNVVAPFALSAGLEELAWQKETRTRTGSIELSNMDEANALTVKIEAPEWLKVEKEVTVEPGKKSLLLLAVEADHGKERTGRVKLTAGGHTEFLDLKAPSSPAVLTVINGLDERLGLHFGRLTALSLPNAKRPFTVLNEGGAPATVKLRVPEHFTLEKPLPEDGQSLAPGAETTFTLVPPKNTAGTFKAELIIEGGDDLVAVECSAGIDPSALPPMPGKLAGLRLIQGRKGSIRVLTPEDQMRQLALTKGATVVDGTEDISVPRVHEVTIAKDTGTEVTFAWDLPPGDGWKFQLFRATLQRLKTGGLGKVFEPCGDEIAYTVEGRRATATVPDLKPHMPFNFRIQTIAPDGRRSFPGKEISYRPFPPDPPAWKRYWSYFALGGILVVLLARWVWKQWKKPISATA
jgi:hypothetical protein